MDLWIPFSEKLLFRLNLTREGVSHCVGTGERTRIILAAEVRAVVSDFELHHGHREGFKGAAVPARGKEPLLDEERVQVVPDANDRAPDFEARKEADRFRDTQRATYDLEGEPGGGEFLL